MSGKSLRLAGRLALDIRAAASAEYVLLTVLIGIGALAALTSMASGIIGIWSGVEGQVVESITGSDEEETGAAELDLGNLNRTTKNRTTKSKKGGQKKRKGKKP